MLLLMQNQNIIIKDIHNIWVKRQKLKYQRKYRMPVLVYILIYSISINYR